MIFFPTATHLPCAVTRGIRAQRAKKGATVLTILIDLKNEEVELLNKDFVADECNFEQ